MWIKGKDLTEDQQQQVVKFAHRIFAAETIDDNVFCLDHESKKNNDWRTMTVKEWIGQRAFKFDESETFFLYHDSIGPVIYAKPAYQKLRHTGLFR